MDPLKQAAALASQIQGNGAGASSAPVLRPSKEIFTPEWNFREAAKHCILCEEHLVDEIKRCPDCLSKHLLAIEAKVEEALGLDTDNVLPQVVQMLPGRIRGIDRMVQGYINRGVPSDPRAIAQEVRQLRKVLVALAQRPDVASHDGGYCADCTAGPCGPGGCGMSDIAHVEMNPYDTSNPTKTVDMPGHMPLPVGDRYGKKVPAKIGTPGGGGEYSEDGLSAVRRLMGTKKR